MKDQKDASDSLQSFAELAVGVGYRPTTQLSDDLKRALGSFQTNLLALFSHELRTPLMGVRNALSALETPDLPDEIREEMLKTALRNTAVLSENLDQLLALADLESGVFHIRLREVDLRGVLVHWLESQSELLDKKIWEKLRTEFTCAQKNGKYHVSVFLDPARIHSFLTWSVRSLASSFVFPESLKLQIVSGEAQSVLISGHIKPETLEKMESVAELVRLQMSSSLSSEDAFLLEGALRSETDFLTRTDEGLGLEWRLLPVIAKRHGATLKMDLKRDSTPTVEVLLTFPHWTEEEAFQRTMEDRMADLRVTMGGFAIVMLRPSEPSHLNVEVLQGFRESIKGSLFRTRDRVFLLKKESVCALLLDDCKRDDIPPLVRRLEQKLKQKLLWGSAHAPEDTYLTDELVRKALMPFNKDPVGQP